MSDPNASPPGDERGLTPEEDAALDAILAQMPEIEPPAALVADTLEAMDALVAASNRAAPAAPPPALADPPAPVVPAANASPAAGWRRTAPMVGLGVALAAAAALVVVPSTPEPGDLDGMTERGVSARLPHVTLKVAVDRDGEVARLSRGAAYGPGDTLYFRASVDDAAWLSLVRVDAQGARMVHQQLVSSGEADLALDSGPLAWRVEPGETDAVFAVLAGRDWVAASEVEAALAGAYTGGDAPAVCAAARALDVRCAAELVRTAP